jgi:biopolymer transport protein ExbB/TolQ
MPWDPIEIMFKGGILMWPILLCSVIGLCIVIERFWFYDERV